MSETPAPRPASIDRLRRRLFLICVAMGGLWLLMLLLPDQPGMIGIEQGLLQWHLVLELFAVIVSLMVAGAAAASRANDHGGQNDVVLWGFSMVAVLDLLHALTYAGMPPFVIEPGTPRGIYFWLAGRGVAVAVLLALALDFRPALSRRAQGFVALGVLAALISVGTWQLEALPALWRPETGVTDVKRSVEIVLCVGYGLAALLFWRLRDERLMVRNLPLAAACLLLAMGETVFTFYVSPSDLSNFFGHAFKVVAYAIIYRAMFIHGVETPYAALAQATRTLEEQENRLRIVAERVPNSVLYQFTREADGTPRFLYLSRGVESVHQITAEAAMTDAGALFSQVLPEDVPMLTAEEERSRQDMTPTDMRVRFRRADGQIRVMRFASQPRQDETGRVVWDGIEWDVTEAEQMRAALDTERALLKSVVDSAMDGIVSTDETGRILLANAATVSMFGRPLEDLVGRNVAELMPERFRGQHGRDFARYRDLESRSRQMGAARAVVGLRADGSEFPLEASISRTVTAGGRQLTVMLRDISRQVDAEQQQASLQRQLQQAQKMEAVGTLAGGIAHDFNNILAIINGNVVLALEDLPPEHPSAVSLREVQRAGQRGRDLVQRILAFSRTRQANPQVLDVAAQLNDSRMLLRPTLPAGIQLDVVIEPGLPQVRMDPVALEQVIVNLCNNAVQAMPDLSGRIRITARPALASSGAPLPDAIIEVSDDGEGMSPAVLERIFEPFFTTKPLGQGTGLGLPMVHGLIKGAGGRIEVQSTPNMGTLFTITLPGCAPDQPVEHQAPLADRPRHARLLYVDDEDALVFLMQRGLSRLGYIVSGFNDPIAAAEAAESGAVDYDVAIVDYNMPYLNGLHLASRLLARHPQRGVILTSGYVDDALETAARAAGVLAVVYKPASIEEMVQVVDRWLTSGNPPGR